MNPVFKLSIWNIFEIQDVYHSCYCRHCIYICNCIICTWNIFLMALDWIKFVGFFSGSTIFPLRFCKHRWLENIVVAERALDIWPSVTKFLTAAKSKTVTEPQNKSYKYLQCIVADKLLEVKTHAFLSIVKVVYPLLIKYQCDEPMLPKGKLTYICHWLYISLHNWGWFMVF